MSKERRFENGRSADEAMGKGSNESISARGLIAMVLLEDLWRRGGYYRGEAKGIRFGGVTVIFKLISRSRR